MSDTEKTTHETKASGGPTGDRRVVLCNPKAGSYESGAGALWQALDSLAARERRESRGEGDLERLAREAAADRDVEEIVVVGGDGSLNEVLNGIAPDFRPRLALVPAGTGNDVAGSLGIPEDPERAIAAIARGESVRLDVLRVDHPAGTRHFLNASAGGFSARVNQLMTGEEKSRYGRLAYYLGAGKALADIESYDVRVAIDGGRPETHEVYNFIVSNGPTIAGGLKLAPGAAHDDGRLHLLLVPALPLVRCAALLARIAGAGGDEARGDEAGDDEAGGDEAGGDEAVIRRGHTVRIEAEPAMSFNADGELTGDTPAEFRILPAALCVVVAAEDADPDNAE